MWIFSCLQLHSLHGKFPNALAKIMGHDLVILRLGESEPMPYELLLLADPCQEMIEHYIGRSEVYVAKQKGLVVGVLVLLWRSLEIAEIKNVAVQPHLQRQGIGGFLIKKAFETVSARGAKSLEIGTANSSIGQLALYQKLGFEITEVQQGYFTQNYPQPIIENGIQAKHRVLLTKQL